jgi:hypothetical protein
MRTTYHGSPGHDGVFRRLHPRVALARLRRCVLDPPLLESTRKSSRHPRSAGVALDESFRRSTTVSAVTNAKD